MMYTEEQLSDLRAQVKKVQTEKRFAHTCGVENEAARIAEIFIPEKASELRAAALLHDLTKCIPDSEQVPLCRELGIDITKTDALTPQILHGWTAEEMIRLEYPLYAIPEILQAVRYHTTGAPDMTMFDKIIFLSDFIESGRPYPACKSMREAFYNGINKEDNAEHLDHIVCDVLLFTLRFLEEKQLPIAPATRDAYLALSRARKKETI